MKKWMIFLGVFVGTIVYGQEFVFEHISSNNGLSNNLVRDITQDEQGYLWFATFGGLNRFDGYMFDVYKPRIGDTLSLSDSRLIKVVNDKNGFVWARSALDEFHRIDPVNHVVINISETGMLPEGALVKSHYLSDNGDLWLILNIGLLHIYYETETATEFKYTYFDNNNGLLSSSVNFVHVDKKENVWIGTTKGLERLQIDTKSKNDRYEFFYEDKLKNYMVVLETKKRMFFGTRDFKLMVFEYESSMFFEDQRVSPKLDDIITSMAVNNKNELLIGTWGGDIAFYNIDANIFNYYQNKITDGTTTSYIGEIFADSYGVFWIVSERRGIYQYNSSKGKLKYFDLNSEGRSFLGEPDKQLILEDSNRDIWVGVNGGGVFFYNRDQDLFKQFKHDPNNTGSLSSDIVLSLFEDKSKNLWIGTSYGGVNKLSLRKDPIRKIKPVENPQTDFDNYIRSLTIDVLGNIWVGTKAGKIYVYKGDRKIGTIPDDLYSSDIFPSTNIYCLFFDNEHNLWIGSKGNGIYILKSLLGYIDDLGNKNIELVHLKNDPNNSNSLSSDNVYTIKQDIHGQYWIGTFKGGLNLLINPFSNPVFQHFSSWVGDASGIVWHEVRDLFFDHDQNLWIATSKGVSILENKYLRINEKRFINLAPSNKDTSSFAGKVVYQIKQAPNNDIYLAMLNGGVNHLSSANFKAGNFLWDHQDSEVLSPNAYSIEHDREGNIWMGTDNGLFRMRADNGIVEKYNVKNSFIPLTFSECCSQKTNKQELIFGSNEGLLVFNPDSIQKQSTGFPIRFSKLEVNGEKVSISKSNILYKSIEEQRKVMLSHFQNNITLTFAVLDYNDPDAIQYKYILEGYDTYWSKPNTSNVATYRKLPPGNYTLNVRGTNSSGQWLNSQAELSIQINPPFWKTKVGYILIILIASLIITIFTIILYREFFIQNKIRIETAITEKRMEYYTNISHEFKTPLSLILGPVEEIIANHKSSDFARQKGMQIKKNAIYLKRLVEQILDFRKIREGKMQLKITEVNITEFFREIYLVFLPLAKKMEIHFEYNYDDEITGYVDVRQLEKVTYNLLSNAFRFTSAGKHVRLCVKSNIPDRLLEVKVADEGTGINDQELPKIFERFSTSKSSSGIGLFFTKEIVMLHRGEIEACNNNGIGATFKFAIPISKDAYNDDELDLTQKSQLTFDLNSIDEIETIISNQNTKDKIHRHVVDYMETVLIVEDSAEMQNYLSTELSARYKILEADNGQMGLEMARKHSPNLIISDVVMPIMNGYEMTRTLKDDFITSHIPIILLTAESTEEKKLQGIESGADDFITKPFNLNYLLTKIEKTITQRKKLKERFEQDMVDKAKPVVTEKEENESDFMEKVQKLVVENLAKPELNVEFLVDQIGMSRTLFFKKMKGASGYAPNEYLRIIRMKEAARLLSSSDKTISEISGAVGFNDSNYFGKTFKKHFGETPSVYKSNNLKRNVI